MDTVTRREALQLAFGGLAMAVMSPVDAFAATKKKYRGKSGKVPKVKGWPYTTVSCLAKDGWHLGGSIWPTPVARDSDCYRIWRKWVKAGAKYKYGICVLDGRYLIACTKVFGRVGDKVTFYCGDDEKTVIKCIIADHKNPADYGCNKWGHDFGRNVLEFEVNPKTYRKKRCNPGCVWWIPRWEGKRVSSWTNLRTAK